MALYQGKATITAVDGKELRWTDGLTEEQIADAILVVLTVQPEDSNFGECDVEIEVSDRECKGKLAGKKQSEISLQSLHRQGLVSKPSIDALEEIFPAVDEDGRTISKGVVGKSVTVYQKESPSKKDDGTVYVNTYLSSNNTLSAGDIRARLARLRGGQKASASTSSSANPFD